VRGHDIDLTGHTTHGRRSSMYAEILQTCSMNGVVPVGLSSTRPQRAAAHVTTFWR